MRETFGDLIRASRRRLGKSLQEVADEIGVTPVYVSEVERGKRPPFITERLAKLSRALKLDFESLLRKAWEEKKMIDFDPTSSDKQIEALMTLARGGLSEEQLDAILKIAQHRQKSMKFK